MDSAETLDLAGSLQGDRTELSLAFTALEKSALADCGSKEKSGIGSLAKYLDPDASFSVVLGMDMSGIMKRLGPYLANMMAMYPEAMRASLNSSMASFSEIYGLLGTGLAVSGDFGETGMRGACYFRPKDPKALLEQYTKVFKELKMPGVTVQGPEPVTVDGLSLSQFHVSVDPKAMTEMAGDKADPALAEQMATMMKKIDGEKGMLLSYGAKGDEVVQVMGGDEAHLHRSLGALKDGGHKLPRDLQVQLDQVASFNPCFLARFDIARMITEFMSLADPAPSGDKAAKPKPPAAAPAPITIFGGVDGRVWRGGASWDMARVTAAMNEAKQTAMSSPAPGTKTSGPKVSKAMSGKAKADIMAIDAALMDYFVLNDKYPDTLIVLVTPDANGRRFLESKSVPLDPWGREYLYEPPGNSGGKRTKPHIYTLGKDGKPGGEGEDADIDIDSMRADGK
jgi:general secretion pathway protein G